MGQRFGRRDFFFWKWTGNGWEAFLNCDYYRQNMCPRQGIRSHKLLPVMQVSEFSIFRTLLNEVHLKAFGEPLSILPHGKAQALSWFIEETTGQLLSYKTLSNFVGAALQRRPESVNPNASTLAILVRYLQGQVAGNDVVVWYKYRNLYFGQEGMAGKVTSYAMSAASAA